jgi:hypothetical protein
MKFFRPDPRTGKVVTGQKISKPTVIPLARELQEELFLTEDIGIIQTTFIEPMVMADIETVEDSPLIQQVEVISSPKSKKEKRRNKKLASRTQIG